MNSYRKSRQARWSELPKKLKRIAIYGKGGIGKSTTTANLAVAAATLGLKTMIVGCDPKADTIGSLVPGSTETVLEKIRARGASREVVRSCIYQGARGVLCVEAGGPSPGVGCAGKGVALALDAIHQYDLFEPNLNLVLFDVLGDVVCGGFAQPMRQNFAEEIYVVTSGEYMALYQAINIAAAIEMLVRDGCPVRMGGLICNKRNVYAEEDIVFYVAKLLGIPVIATIPRMDIVQAAEGHGRTVCELYPDSEAADHYFELTRSIYLNQNTFVPTVADRRETSQRVKDFIREVGARPGETLVSALA